MSRKDQLLRILAVPDGHFASDDVSPAAARTNAAGAADSP
jgi:hypothetical protein